jgi:hypothetical protein
MELHKLSLVAGVLAKHGVVMTTAATAAGTGYRSGTAVTGVTVATALASTATTDRGVIQTTATAMAGTLRVDVPQTCLGAVSKTHQQKLGQTTYQA